MNKAKVLYVSQDITPYLPETSMGVTSRYLPQGIQEKGKEIRTFMPRYGCINERRHQLHEVIRLSGMNLVVDDTDHPLIIKVASIQSARMQVYFIDNEEFFHRKATLTAKDGSFFEDNDERSIFFNRGVIETAKKLGWQPDLIHCHGWFTGLMGLYIKRIYKDNPLFADAKVVISIYDDEFPATLNKNFAKKLLFDGISKQDADAYKNPTFANVMKAAIDIADGVIKASPKINPDIEKHLKKAGKPVLEYQSPDNYINAYSDFYDMILEEAQVMA